MDGDADRTRAHVRLIDPAVDDLVRLVRADPQVVRQVVKKMLLLERDPNAGDPLLGALVGFRKLTVGDRHWRIVWRTTTDDLGRVVVEIAEVWAVGARADAAVYAEMEGRVADLPDNPRTQALADVIGLLGRTVGAVGSVAREPAVEPVPQWLVERLVHTAGRDEDEVRAMDPEAAMEAWEAFITRPPA